MRSAKKKKRSVVAKPVMKKRIEASPAPTLKTQKVTKTVTEETH